MALFGLASGRQLDHLIGPAVHGWIHAMQPSIGPASANSLNTEQAAGALRAWLAAHCAPLVCLYPQHDYGLVMRHDPKFRAVYCRTCVPFLPVAAQLMASLPEVMLSSTARPDPW